MRSGGGVVLGQISPFVSLLLLLVWIPAGTDLVSFTHITFLTSTTEADKVTYLLSILSYVVPVMCEARKRKANVCCGGLKIARGEPPLSKHLYSCSLPAYYSRSRLTFIPLWPKEASR